MFYASRNPNMQLWQLLISTDSMYRSCQEPIKMDKGSNGHFPFFASS